MQNEDPHFRLKFLFADVYRWLCHSREKHPPSSDIWNFWRCWNEQADLVIEEFSGGIYSFDVQKKII
jgi:hypothetical protein